MQPIKQVIFASFTFPAGTYTANRTEVTTIVAPTRRQTTAVTNKATQTSATTQSPSTDSSQDSDSSSNTALIGQSPDTAIEVSQTHIPVSH